MSRARFAFAALGLALAACGDPAPRTQVMVSIVAEPGIDATATRLFVQVFATDATGFVPDGTGTVVLPASASVEQTLGTNASPVEFPVEVALLPLRGDATRRYLVLAEAVDASGTTLARVRAISGYVPGRTLSLALTLEDACNGVLSCANGQTCRAGVCSTAVVPTEDLTPYVPPNPSDAGTDAGLGDAGMTAAHWIQRHYLKTSINGSFVYTGTSVAIDGDLLVLGLPGDSQNASGINPTPAAGSVSDSGAVVIFHRDSLSGQWSEEAFIKADCNDANYRFGASVAISGDLLAVGVPGDDSVNTGTSANCGTGTTLANAGAVYLYRRGQAGTWTSEEFVKANHTSIDDRFGEHVALAGTRLVVGASGDDSGWATGDNGGADPWFNDGVTDNRKVDSGSVYVYAYEATGMSWSVEQHLKAHSVDADDRFGASLDFDGTYLAVGAPGEDGNGRSPISMAPFPTSNARTESGAAYVFTRTGMTWAQTAYLKGSRTQTQDEFGISVALSGSLVAVAAIGDDSGGVGVNPPDLIGSGGNSGAVYLFERGGAWAETTYFKPSARAQPVNHMVVALRGNALAVGIASEDSTSSGIDSTSNAATNADTTNAGAAFVYERSVGGVWSLTGYIKPVSPRALDEFATSVALSTEGFLLVGCPLEDGSGTVVDAPVDMGADNAGAGFLFSHAP